MISIYLSGLVALQGKSAVTDSNEWSAVMHGRWVEDSEASMTGLTDAPATSEVMGQLPVDPRVMKRF